MDVDAAGPQDDTVGPSLDQSPLVEISIVRIGRPQPLDDDSLDLAGGYSPDRPRVALAPLKQHRGDIVPLTNPAFFAMLGLIRLPRSSKMRPRSRAPEAARCIRQPFRLEVGFSCTASNSAGATIGACSPGWLAPLWFSSPT